MRRDVSAGVHERRPRFGWVACGKADGYPQPAY
jgi:hypothetical protein